MVCDNTQGDILFLVLVILDARYLHDVLQKLWTIFNLNLAAIELSEDIEEVGPDFWKLTTLAPAVDRVDPLKVQQKVDEVPP